MDTPHSHPPGGYQAVGALFRLTYLGKATDKRDCSLLCIRAIDDGRLPFIDFGSTDAIPETARKHLAADLRYGQSWPHVRSGLPLTLLG